MAEQDARTRVDKVKQARRALISSCVGTSVEWYEYFIYGTAAALYFGPLFFPNKDPAIARLIAFASFGVAFLAGCVMFLVRRVRGAGSFARSPADVAVLLLLIAMTASRIFAEVGRLISCSRR